MSAATKQPSQREEFYARLDTRSLAPLWERLKGLVPAEPRPKTQPFLWKWDDMRPMVLEAGSLLTAEEAERRVLVLENPTFPGMSRATNTLYAGVQLVMPGEVAPAHRHTQSALRFVLEAEEGAYTAVGGERTTMRTGDFIITPAWAWHDHGNTGTAPVMWMDVLDLPIGGFLDTGFSEHHNDKEQSISRPEDDALWRFGTGLMPIEEERPYGGTSPIFNYPWSRTRPALVGAAKDLDPHWGATLRFNNPLDGGWAMPTIATWMTHLPTGVRTKPVRSTDSVIAAVAEGRGTVTVGDTRMSFGPRDIFILPNWTWRSFEASEDLFLFCASDRVVHEKLGLYRLEKQP